MSLSDHLTDSWDYLLDNAGCTDLSTMGDNADAGPEPRVQTLGTGLHAGEIMICRPRLNGTLRAAIVSLKLRVFI